ncbi:MAG: hypothetical protein IH951_06600 [Bacteroidetes bacterium]|nr:hypothetical protein [Bacteroidota bacterium]
MSAWLVQPSQMANRNIRRIVKRMPAGGRVKDGGVKRVVRDEFDTGILISSDTDLVPALREVRKNGKKQSMWG